MKVFKYKIPVEDYIQVGMPGGAQILSFQVQSGELCIWALVDSFNPIEVRCFRFAGTGHEISETKESLRFVGTIQLRAGSLVFHLFEIIK